jgi:hypothetical protein
MIDPSIYKIYKEEKKVFIPDFGAIIYSEATDTIDFNELLTFDDGKVIEEIQSKQKSGKREARKALKDHIAKVKAKLEDGKPHLIRGLGYLFKDEEGSYAIQKNKPEIKKAAKKTAEKDQENEVIIPPVDLEPEQEELNINDEFEAENEVEEAKTEVIEPDDFASDLDKPQAMADDVEEEDYAQSTGTEEDEYAYKPFLSEENEDVQEYYKRKDEYYDGDDRRKRLWFYAAAAILILMLTAAGLYYFVFDSDQDFDSSAQTSMASAEPMSTQPEEQTAPENASESAANQGDYQVTENAANEQRATSEPAASTASSISSPTYGSNNRTYSLILGSFRVDENANNFHRYLTDKQLDVRIFNWGGSFQFVGFERIEGKDEALKLLAEMREEEEPTAWIIRNKQ